MKKYFKEDLIGLESNYLTIIKEIKRKEIPNRRFVLCKCSCGNETTVRLDRFLSGVTKSCGCLKKENNIKKRGNWYYKHRLCQIWSGIIQRCYNQNDTCYDRYGKRGISVDMEWKNNMDSFIKWAMSSGYNDNLTIDRIDNDGNYSPDNCRWVDMSTQLANTGIRCDNTTGYKGLSWSKLERKWRVYVSWHGKRILDKCFNDKRDALIFRNNFIIDNNLPHKINEVDL